jgi:cytidylate kinase
MADRARLYMEKKGGTYDEAVKQIEHVENRRANYYNYYTGKHWGHAASYDLCIDSSVLGLEGTARLIAEFVRGRVKNSCP